MQRIIEGYAGAGPYRLLYRLHEEKRRASVMIRRVNRCVCVCACERESEIEPLDATNSLLSA